MIYLFIFTIFGHKFKAVLNKGGIISRKTRSKITAVGNTIQYGDTNMH